MSLKLTEAQITVAIHALRVAADRFADDANNMRDMAKIHGATFASLAEHFDGQERDSRKLADFLEETT